MAMSSALIVLIVLVVIVLVVVLAVVGMYNRLVTLRNRYKNAFSQIDVQLKRRYDLIPNLVEVAKGYIKHERETLEAVIKARNAAYSAGQQAARSPGDATAMTALGGAEGQLDRRPGPAVRRGRGLSRPEGQPEHARPARGAVVHGEQDRLRPAGLQRRRHGLQHAARGVSHDDHRRRCSTSRRRTCSRSSRPHGAGSPQGFVHVDRPMATRLLVCVTTSPGSMHGHRFLRPAGSRTPPDEAAAGYVRPVGGGHHRGDLSGGGRRD